MPAHQSSRQPPLGLYPALLVRFAGIVGEGAAVATFHFAAMQEGMEAAQKIRPGPERLEEALEAAAAALGHEAVAEGLDKVLIRITQSPLLVTQSAVAAAVVSGFYEGILRGVTGIVHDGRFDPAGPGAGTLHLSRRAA